MQVSRSKPGCVYRKTCEVNKAGNCIIFKSNHAPIKEARIAGTPNRISTIISVFLPTNTILKRLLQKCTTPVSATAISTGKKMANTGAKIVPSPNPEKKVRMAAAKAASVMMIMSIISYRGTINLFKKWTEIVVKNRFYTALLKILIPKLNGSYSFGFFKEFYKIGRIVK